MKFGIELAFRKISNTCFRILPENDFKRVFREVKGQIFGVFGHFQSSFTQQLFSLLEYGFLYLIDHHNPKVGFFLNFQNSFKIDPPGA